MNSSNFLEEYLYHSYALDRIMYGTENPEKNKHLSGMNILALFVHFR